MAISVVAVIVGLFEIAKQRKLTPATGFALFSFIWLFSLMIEIVIFTGWVTGTGDDHTTRVLLRYYEFLFVIVPLAGLSIFAGGVGARANVWLRWALFFGFATLLTPAFTGFFASLTIQIADAPTLAGLVVNREIFNAVALAGFLSIFVYATFPKLAIWTFALVLPLSMVGTGWQIQDQYQGFRGTLSSADKAGQYLRDNLSSDEIDRTWILATSRFEATNIAIWADSAELDYELLVPGSQISVSSVPKGIKFVLTTSDLSLEGLEVNKHVGDGFTLYKIP
jgi:hypothetical protein